MRARAINRLRQHHGSTVPEMANRGYVYNVFRGGKGFTDDRAVSYTHLTLPTKRIV